MERDAFYGDFMVKLIWRLSGNWIHQECISSPGMGM